MNDPAAQSFHPRRPDAGIAGERKVSDYATAAPRCNDRALASLGRRIRAAGTPRRV